jgi:hypothetical protein
MVRGTASAGVGQLSTPDARFHGQGGCVRGLFDGFEEDDFIERLFFQSIKGTTGEEGTAALGPRGEKSRVYGTYHASRSRNLHSP